MRKQTEQLTDIIRPAVDALGYELLGCDYISQGKHSVLRIYIDSPNGILVDDCAAVSRQVSAILDVEDPISSEYTLEVSSPGLERPLFTLEQFQKFTGHEAKLRLHAPLNNRRNFRGKIERVEEDTVVLTVEQEQVEIPFNEIEKANLISEI